MARVVLSTTVTGTGAVLAARSAAAQVPEILALKCTETIASYPASARSAYRAPITSGAGREVLTRRPARSAAATSAAGTSDSGRLRSSITTCNGITATLAPVA
jgi:hypothetical protein